MPKDQTKKHLWTVSHTDVQWWTDTPQLCFTCGDSDRLVLNINGQLVSQKLGIPCAPEALPTIRQYIRSHPDVPHWAKNDYPRVHDADSPPDNLLIPGPESCCHFPTIQSSSTVTGQGHSVLIDGNPLSPDRSRKLLNKSPSEFSWGYRGAGPSQLALALLLEAGASNREAVRHFQEFKRQLIALIPFQAKFTFTGSTVIDWLHRTRPAKPACTR